MAIKQSESIYQLKITLQGSKPPIWRRVLVPDSIKLDEFHELIQIVMGWQNYHLHQFHCNGTLYSIPNDEFDDFDIELKNETDYQLSQLLTAEKSSLLYEYDMGDGWEHKIVLEKILPFDSTVQLPQCIKGKRACPPEDCGGIWGYKSLLEILKDKKHPQHEEMLEWLGGDFDSEYFDLDEINAQLR